MCKGVNDFRQFSMVLHKQSMVSVRNPHGFALGAFLCFGSLAHSGLVVFADVVAAVSATSKSN